MADVPYDSALIERRHFGLDLFEVPQVRLRRELARVEIFQSPVRDRFFKVLDDSRRVKAKLGHRHRLGVNQVLDLKPLVPKFEAFGWFVQEINGHDQSEVLAAFDKARNTKGRPSAIVARTIKGYPLQHLLASDPNHHGKPLTPEEEKQTLALLGA